MKLIIIFFILLIKNLNKKDNFVNLYFIRHAEGFHNRAAKQYGHKEYESIKWFDAELTNKGIND